MTVEKISENSLGLIPKALSQVANLGLKLLPLCIFSSEEKTQRLGSSAMLYHICHFASSFLKKGDSCKCINEVSAFFYRLLANGFLFVGASQYFKNELSLLLIYNFNGQHYLEEAFSDFYGEDFLSWSNPQNHSQTSLILYPEDDYNNAFYADIELRIFPLELFKSNLKFAVIAYSHEICSHIKSAPQSISRLVIAGHGSKDSVTLSKRKSGSLKDLSELSEDCFENLKEDAEISVVSCSFGAALNSTAQKLAIKAKRTVLAAIDNISYREISFKNSTLFFQSAVKKLQCPLSLTRAFFKNGTSRLLHYID